jgi:hypothetical protein
MAVATYSEYAGKLDVKIPLGVSIEETMFILENRDLYPTDGIPDFVVLDVNPMQRTITVGHRYPGDGPKLQNSLPGHIDKTAQELTD